MKIGGFILAAAVFAAGMAASGCRAPVEHKFSKLPAEDIDVMTVFADDIAVLKNPEYSPGGLEKYTAARHIADGVDFSFARNVSTLDNIFGARDARIAVMSTTSQIISFHYEYEGKVVQFNFSRSKNLITQSAVIVE